MNKVLKYALIALAVLLFVAVAVAVYVAATFDANAYKPKIIRLVKERTQRTLTIFSWDRSELGQGHPERREVRHGVRVGR
jgi:hypothetical protein